MIDVSALVGDIPTTTITVRTFAASTLNAYGEAEATYTDAARDAVVHPADRRDLERLPAADRSRETIAIYTTAPITTAGTTRPMQVQYDGRWFEVVSVANYAELGGIYLAWASLLDA